MSQKKVNEEITDNDFQNLKQVSLSAEKKKLFFSTVHFFFTTSSISPMRLIRFLNS
jgi:hypothetical protein